MEEFKRQRAAARTIEPFTGEYYATQSRIDSNKSIINQWLEKRLAYYKSINDTSMISSIYRLQNSMLNEELNIEATKRVYR